MALSWTPELVAEEVRRQTTVDGLVDVIALCFGISGTIRREVAEYDALKQGIDRYESGKLTQLEAYDLYIAVTKKESDRLVDMIFPMTDEGCARKRKLFMECAKIDLANAVRDAGAAFVAEKILSPSDLTNLNETERQYSERSKELNNISGAAAAAIREYHNSEELKELVEQSPEYVKNEEDYESGEINEAVYQHRRIMLWAEIRRKELEKMPQRQVMRDCTEELERLEKDRAYRNEKLHDAVMDALYEASSVSMEDARAWVQANVSIDEAAEAQLKKTSQYSIAHLRNDMADIYRILDGKIGPITFTHEKNGPYKNRSFARGRSEVFVQGDFSKKTLFHEVGHIAENWDITSQNACCKFLERRATGPAQSLRKLTGNSGYEKDEVALPDSFISPYIGRINSFPHTEVISMSLQCLADPAQLAHLLTKDREHFDMLMGMLQHKSQTLSQEVGAAVKASESRQRRKQAEKEANDRWLDALDKVANRQLLQRLDFGESGCRIARRGSRYSVLVYGKINDFMYVQDGKLDNDEGWRTIGNISKKKDCLRFAYLFIAAKKNLLSGINPADAPRLWLPALLKYLIERPDWFEDGSELPEVI